MRRKRRGKSVPTKGTPPAKRGADGHDVVYTVPPDELKRLVASVLEERLEFSAIISEKYMGPVPHPDHLKQFEAIQPGSADRIFTMTEQQLAHSRNMDSRVVESNLKIEARGQLFAFIITLAIIGAGVYLISAGHPVWGFVQMIGAVGALVGVFIYGTRRKRGGQAGAVSVTGKGSLQTEVPQLADKSEQQAKSLGSKRAS